MHIFSRVQLTKFSTRSAFLVQPVPISSVLIQRRFILAWTYWPLGELLTRIFFRLKQKQNYGRKKVKLRYHCRKHTSRNGEIYKNTCKAIIFPLENLNCTPPEDGTQLYSRQNKDWNMNTKARFYSIALQATMPCTQNDSNFFDPKLQLISHYPSSEHVKSAYTWLFDRT